MQASVYVRKIHGGGHEGISGGCESVPAKQGKGGLLRRKGSQSVKDLPLVADQGGKITTHRGQEEAEAFRNSEGRPRSGSKLKEQQNRTVLVSFEQRQD